MNTDRIKAKSEALAERRADDIRDQLMQAPRPVGVNVERSGDGIRLVGKNLRRRMLDDPKLRNFGR
ncbi:MAG: hypothetical protein ACK4ZE_03330 [Sphingorhabdus sp.]